MSNNDNNMCSPFSIVTTTVAAEEILADLGIPILGVIVPIPDPIYGHTFRLPEPVTFRIRLNSLKQKQAVQDRIIEAAIAGTHDFGENDPNFIADYNARGD